MGKVLRLVFISVLSVLRVLSKTVCEKLSLLRGYGSSTVLDCQRSPQLSLTSQLRRQSGTMVKTGILTLNLML